MKKYSSIFIFLTCALFGSTLIAQNKSKVKKVKNVKKVKRIKRAKIAKVAKIKLANGKYVTGKVTVKAVGAGQSCTTEGETGTRETTTAGTCQALGKNYPCTCDLTINFECKDGQFTATSTELGVCHPTGDTKVPINKKAPEKIMPY